RAAAAQAVWPDHTDAERWTRRRRFRYHPRRGRWVCDSHGCTDARPSPPALARPLLGLCLGHHFRQRGGTVRRDCRFHHALPRMTPLRSRSLSNARLSRILKTGGSHLLRRDACEKSTFAVSPGCASAPAWSETGLSTAHLMSTCRL